MDVEYCQRGASSGRDRGQGKVCIVCTCDPEDSVDGHDEYRLYIVDLDGDSDCGFNFLAPTLRIGSTYSLYTQAFCVLDSTLYIFGTLSDPLGGKSVYTYRLRSNDSNLRLEPHMLVQIDDMHDLKDSPVAIPTPDRKKILVFSSEIKHYDDAPDESADDLCDFELFDPVLGSWEKLAGFPDCWRNVDILISAYTFMDNRNVLLLQSDKAMFTLDFGSPHQRWERFPNAPDAPVPLPIGNYFILIENDLYLTSSLVYDKEDTFDIPGISPVGSCCITLLDVDNTECKFCTVQSQINMETMRPHVTVNVYSLDKIKYRMEKERMEKEKMEDNVTNCSLLPATTILKSFDFLLDVEANDGWAFEPYQLFSIPAGTPLN